MSIFILTHPFYGNYGGMLQAYALQQVLETNGIDSRICQYYRYPSIPLFKEIARVLYNWVREGIAFFIPRLGRKNVSPIHKYRYGEDFLLRYTKSASLEEAHSSAKAWIVGSDQVWRAEYARSLSGLDFFCLTDVSKDLRTKSITYAASFGTETWSATKEEAKLCAAQLKDFKAVSVREHSGVEICRSRMGIEAVQMPDPTLLLSIEEYNSLIDQEKNWKPASAYIAVYILDRKHELETELLSTSQQTQIKLQHLTPSARAKKRRDRFPVSVPQWLRLIRDCKYLITDSFHGCVFAIIFNKPFVCLGNINRGNARFDSLLKTFELQDRLLTHATPESIRKILQTPIDWERVNAIHDTERERGINFLRQNLSD